MTGAFLPTRINDKENMEKISVKKYVKLQNTKFKSPKTIGIPRFLGFSKQNRPYNCFLCGLAGKILTFSKTIKCVK